tara:strand:- start:381 stop:1217 length:837 start_codon:yes stop_codon:yes gene_type:complete
MAPGQVPVNKFYPEYECRVSVRPYLGCVFIIMVITQLFLLNHFKNNYRYGFYIFLFATFLNITFICFLINDNLVISCGEGYRLGDMIRGYWRNYYEGEEFHLKQFPDSIASKYMKKTLLPNQYDILADIVKTYSPVNPLLKKPSKRTVVIHIRAGDTIDSSDITVDEFCNGPPRPSFPGHSTIYVMPLDYFEKEISKIKESITNISIVYGKHNTKSMTKSNEYISRLENMLKLKFSKNVSRINNDNPDDDFWYMCHSNYFISSGGNFSSIIKETKKYL